MIAWPENGFPICTASDVQTGARLSVDNQGGVYFVWQDDRNGGSNADVYVQHINSSETVVMNTNGVAISNESLIQKAPVVRADQSGGAFMIWEDGRAGSGAIYGQYLSASNPSNQPDFAFETN